MYLEMSVTLKEIDELAEQPNVKVKLLNQYKSYYRKQLQLTFSLPSTEKSSKVQEELQRFSQLYIETLQLIEKYNKKV